MFAVLLMVLLLALLFCERKQQRLETEKLQKMQQKLDLKQEKQNQELSDKESQDSFFQKLSDGFKVNILIVGDSIGRN